MTSNIGSQMILNLNKGGGLGLGRIMARKNEDKIREKLWTLLREQFKPEFLNRIDETIIFHSLSEKQIEKIVDLQILKVEDRLKRKRKITLDIDSAVRKHLAKTGYDPDFGARQQTGYPKRTFG